MKLIILGAGGHGQVVADLAQQSGKYEQITFLDDNSTGDNILGKCSAYLNFKAEDTEMYPAFGNNEARLSWENRMEQEGIALAKIVSDRAYVSPRAKIANGSVVMPLAVVNTDTILEKACIVNVGAIVDHRCVLEAGCHIAPGAIVKAENRLPRYTKVDSGETVEARSMPLK